MHITINAQAVQLHDTATLADAIAHWQPQPPFAAAVNEAFVPRSQYAAQPLREGDRVDIIAPVTGG